MVKAWCLAARVALWDSDGGLPVSWIARFDEMEGMLARLQRPDIALELAEVAIASLEMSEPQSPRLQRWLARGNALIESALASDLVPAFGAARELLFRHAWWLLDIHRGQALIEHFGPLARTERIGLGNRILWLMDESYYHLHQVDLVRSAESALLARALAEQNGLHLGHVLVEGVLLLGHLLRGDVAGAELAHQRLWQIHGGRSPRIMLALRHYLSGTMALLQGAENARKAHESAARAVELVDGVGLLLLRVRARTLLAIAANRAGMGEPTLEAVVELCRSAAYAPGEFACRLERVATMLAQGPSDAALGELASVLALGKSLGMLALLEFDSGTLSRLCSAALEHHIEPDYVREIIQRRRVPSTRAAPPGAQHWPWRIVILINPKAAEPRHVVMAVTVNGEKLAFSPNARAQVALLGGLALAGEEGSSAGELSALIWPGCGEKEAKGRFDTTLSRLRVRLGCPEAVVCGQGRYRIDAGQVRVVRDAGRG